MYRDEEGNKCAVGQIIPDSLYNEKMEGSAIVTYQTFKLVKEFIPLVEELQIDSTGVRLLSRLQSIHDTDEVKDWEEQWTMLAKGFNLEMPVRLLEN